MIRSDRTCLQHWIRNRDANAFSRLTSKYSGLVYATCLRITANHVEAEDATQECFATLATVAAVPRSPLGAWLHRVATNGALDLIKARNRRVYREANYARERADSVEIEWKDVNNLVDLAITELPENMRAPIVAHFLEGESYTSIAEAAGTTRQTIANRVEAGIKRLRRGLKKRGVVVSASTLAAMMTTQLAQAATLPAATSAALGKIALAGALHSTSVGGGTVASGTISAGANLLGGLVMAKSTVLGLGVVVALVLGAAVYTVQKNNLGVETERVAAKDNESGASGAERRAEDDAANANALLTEEVNAAHARIAELEAKLIETTIALEDAEAQGALLKAAGPARAKEQNKSNSEKQSSLHVYLAAGVIPIKATGLGRYKALFALLRLPADVQAKVREVLEENLSQLAAGGLSKRALRSENLDPGPLEDVLNQLLTQEELQLWKDYEGDIEYYQTVRFYEADLIQNASGLTGESRTLIASTLAEERLASDLSQGFSDSIGNWERDLHVLENTRGLLSDAFEDAEQSALFEDYVAQQQGIIQERMDTMAAGGPIELEIGGTLRSGGVSFTIVTPTPANDQRTTVEYTITP